MRRPIIFTSIFPPSIFKQFPSNRFRNMPYRSSATFFLSRFDDLQARVCDDEIVQRPRRVPPSFLFPLMCIEIVISSCIVCSAFFYSLADHSTNVAFRRGWIRRVRDLPSRKKKKETCSLWKILWWWTPGGRAEENIFAIQATIDHSHC